MLSENIIELINKVVSKETFKYTGEIIHGVDQLADIDYKFRITGHKKMMSVGEYYDYLLLEVTITGVNDPVSKLIFTPEPTDTGKMVARAFESQLYRFYSILNQEIMDYLKYFNNTGEIIRTTIDDLRFDLKNIDESAKLNFANNKNLSKFVSILESQMSRISKIAVRTTVKDILNIIKKGQEGGFYLPDENGGEYSFTNLPFKYSVKLSLEIDNELSGYQMNGNFSSDDDVIEIMVKYNPKTLKKNFYNIIGELNDIVAHELEHGFQYNRDGHTYQEPPTESFEYYTQPHEITAQRVGFRRVSKLRKLPFNDVVRDWFEDHKDIHGLTDDEMDKVIKIILNDK
jgi:hypothetical protein